MQDLPSDMTEDGELSDAAGEMNPDIRADAEEYDANTPTGAEQGEEDKEDIDPQEEARSTLLEQLDAIVRIDDPPTQLIRNLLVDLVKKKNQLDELAIALKEETEGKSTKGSAKGGKKGKRKRAGGGTKPRPKKRKDTNETSEVTEIGKGLKTKWRQLETSDLTELALVDTKDTPKLGRQSKYVHALQTLAEQVMLKRVNNKESWIVVGLENADDFLEVARAITNLNSITQLAKQVKYLIEDRPGDFESAIAENELHDDCYDQTGGLTNIGNIVKLGIDIVRIETNDTTRRIRHRYNCVKIANFYEKEQLKEKELRTDVSKRGKGGKGKGIASHVKKTIIELVNCTYARLDGWIKLGKAIAPFVDEYGLGVLGLIPHEISDHRLLGLPINSLSLIVYAINELDPKIKELSVLIENHLLRHLLERSSPSIGALRTMLAQARELNLQSPFTEIIDSMRVSITASLEN